MNPLNTEVKFLKGVGEKRASLLAKLDILTIEDLIEFFPRTYIHRKNNINIKDITPGETVSLVGKIKSIEIKKTKTKKEIYNIYISDGTASLICTWFSGGKWIVSNLKIGMTVWVSGTALEFLGSFQITHPEIEVFENEESDFWKSRSILPVYHLTKGISNKLLRDLIVNAFSLYHKHIYETLPTYILKKTNLPERYIALQRMHFPTENTDIEKTRMRFAFEEFFYQQIMFFRVKGTRKSINKGIKFVSRKTYTTELKNSLPFSLTKAQKRVIREIVSDMTSDKRMMRLLQGDVGSGKTIVTLFAILLAIENNYQAALMVPTELLAEQHFKTITSLLSNQKNIQILLLKGGNYKGKKSDKEKIASGEINVVIGTHALIQKDIIFHNLGLAIIDEQHRFGVKQRSLLSTQNTKPDILYLTATPIPRSLALTVFGDLDVSIIDELPPNRKPVKTFWRSSTKRKLVYQEILSQLNLGRQAYIVCPLIEESEKLDLLDATTLFNEISQLYAPKYKTALLHGKMKPTEKDQIMKDFKENKYQVLVSTTVIEVGIDVPNASVMVIEHSERFGLSQLHQLRGRVGRGSDEAFCYLISYPPISAEGKARLTVMVESNDGFVISEKDLEIRGPGDFFGTEQSGMIKFKHANLMKDQNLLKIARKFAMEVIKKDINFTLDEHNFLKKHYFEKYLKKEKLFNY